MDKEAVTIASECLRILVLLHTLSQGSESQKAVMNLLLEGIIMILSPSTEGHEQVNPKTELQFCISFSSPSLSHFVLISGTY